MIAHDPDPIITRDQGISGHPGFIIRLCATCGHPSLSDEDHAKHVAEMAEVVA